MSPFNVFIGVDERQPIAGAVAAHSITQNSSVPVAITQLVQKQLPVKRRGLTSFTYTRYLVPWLCEFQGWALFVDADILVRGDIVELFNAVDKSTLPAVSVVPHTAVQKNKELVSVMFERNAVMLFNCEKCSKLTPEYIDTLAHSPNKLSEWAESIGELPKEWNHLVGYDQPNPNAKLVHFTMGIPCFSETREDEFGEEWRSVHNHMNGTVSWTQIMGSSVHARWKK